MMESSLYGYAEHGYDYNLTSVNFQDILSKGSQEAKEQWKTMPLSTPGLFNLAVCEIPNLAFVTGGEQVQLDVSLCPGRIHLSFSWRQLLTCDFLLDGF